VIMKLIAYNGRCAIGQFPKKVSAHKSWVKLTA
jgi:hypothetical protein